MRRSRTPLDARAGWHGLAIEVRAMLGVDVGDPLAGEFRESLGDQQRRESFARARRAVHADFECRLFCFCFSKWYCHD